MDTWRLGWQPKSSRVLTTCKWPLLTAICNGVCRLLFLAFKSAPPLCSTSMTEPSSPKAAWCTALSPSLSWAQRQTRIMTQVISQMTYSCKRCIRTRRGKFNEVPPTSASRSTLCLSSSFRTSTCPFWLAACMAVCPAHWPFTCEGKEFKWKHSKQPLSTLFMFGWESIKFAFHLKGQKNKKGVFKHLCASVDGGVCMFHRQLQRCKNSEHKY